MLQLIKFLKKKNISSILYSESPQKISFNFLSLLEESLKGCWFVVVTTLYNDNRKIISSVNNMTFIIKPNDDVKYKFAIKFDAAFIPFQDFVLNEDITKCAKYVISLVPFNTNLKMLRNSMNFYNRFNNIKEFYFPHSAIKFLPIKIQQFLSKFKFFSDKNIKLVMGKT